MIYLASDHAGYQLKESLKKILIKKQIIFEDLGTQSEDSVDYPDFGHKLAEKVIEHTDNQGIGICGSGLGISMALNRHAGIRAARCTSLEDAKMSRLHNDANVLVLAGRQTDKVKAIKMLEVFLVTKFENGRHKKRIEKIEIKN